MKFVVFCICTYVTRPTHLCFWPVEQAVRLVIQGIKSSVHEYLQQLIGRISITQGPRISRTIIFFNITPPSIIGSNHPPNNYHTSVMADFHYLKATPTNPNNNKSERAKSERRRVLETIEWRLMVNCQAVGGGVIRGKDGG